MLASLAVRSITETASTNANTVVILILIPIVILMLILILVIITLRLGSNWGRSKRGWPRESSWVAGSADDGKR